MGMTMTQKILAAHAGLDSVKAGDLIEAKLDLVLGNDVTTPVAVKEFDKAGFTKVFDKDKIAIVLDHYTPCKDIKSAELCATAREFAKRFDITHFGGCADGLAFVRAAGDCDHIGNVFQVQNIDRQKAEVAIQLQISAVLIEELRQNIAYCSGSLNLLFIGAGEFINQVFIIGRWTADANDSRIQLFPLISKGLEVLLSSGGHGIAKLQRLHIDIVSVRVEPLAKAVNNGVDLEDRAIFTGKADQRKEYSTPNRALRRANVQGSIIHGAAPANTNILRVTQQIRQFIRYSQGQVFADLILIDLLEISVEGRNKHYPFQSQKIAKLLGKSRLIDFHGKIQRVGNKVFL